MSIPNVDGHCVDWNYEDWKCVPTKCVDWNYEDWIDVDLVIGISHIILLYNTENCRYFSFVDVQITFYILHCRWYIVDFTLEITDGMVCDTTTNNGKICSSLIEEYY